MVISCAIIDDEPLAAGLLESYVKKTPYLELKGTYNSAVTAMRDLRDDPVQLLFLDIQMPELSGIEFAKILPHETKVIFTTAFSQYAIEGFRVSALDYLLKPIGYEDFRVSLYDHRTGHKDHEPRSAENRYGLEAFRFLYSFCNAVLFSVRDGRESGRVIKCEDERNETTGM